MAELGAVASVVQLADVALRISGEVCKFLDAYKSANRDVKLLWDALRDVEANIRNLQGYVVRFPKSKAAVDEFDNLSETIMGALKGYDADIDAVKRVLPSKPLEKVEEKARWVLKKRERQELMERITQRNSSLVTALGIMESQQSLRIHKDTQEILAKQTASNVVASRNLAKIDSKMQRQEETQVELLSQSRNIVDSIQSMKTSSNRQYKTLTSVATQQAARTNDRLELIDRTGSCLVGNTTQANIKLDELSNHVQQTSRQTQQKIDAMITGMEGIHAKATFSGSSIDTITRVVREEIRATLRPLVEEAFNQKQTHREVALQRLEDLNDAVTREIGFDVSTQRSVEASEWHALHTAYSNECIANQKREDSWRTQRALNFTKSLIVNQESPGLHYTVSTYKRRWSHESSFGMLEIEIKCTNHRIDGSPQSRSYTSVKVHFWPAQKYLRLPQISAFYSTAPTFEGYYQLAPTIALYPTLDDDHLVFSVVESGDLAALQKMLSSGQIHPRSCDSMGRTLLHSAAWHLSVDICQFLRSQGLSWYQESIVDSVSASLRYALFPYIHHPWQSDILEILWDIIDTIEHPGDYNYDEYFWLCYYYAYGVIREPYNYSQFEQNFRRRWPDYWDQFMADALSTAIGGQGFDHSSDTIEGLLQRGVNPNMLNYCGESSLTNVLTLAAVHKYDGYESVPDPEIEWQVPPRRTLDRPEPSEEYFGVPSRSAYERYFPCITVLIMGGADIYHIKPASFDWVEYWDELPSHSQMIINSGIFDGWRIALERSGRDPDYVFLEDERRRKQALRLHGATRSGVDEAMLDPPPIDGLRCRRCRRKYCNYHDLSIFE